MRRDVEILVLPVAEDIARRGAEILIETARASLQSESRCSVALSGGTTPQIMYDVLKQTKGEERELLRQVHYFFGDERAVSNEDEKSNVHSAVTGFLESLDVPDDQIHRLDGAAQDLDEEARRATKDLLATVPAARGTSVPELDLIFLGLGSDGHTASLFPGTAALDVRYPDSLGFVANTVPQLKTRRLTLSFDVINTARRLVFLCTGEAKALVLRDVLGTPDRKPCYPVDRVGGRRVTWLLDAPAGALLPPELLSLSETT